MTAITFNLDDSLVEFIKTFAKKNNITQKEVIQRSLEKTKKEILREEIIKESIELANNKELQEECLWLANA
jgi:predicted transcriptional regulator